jgi:hypothetical protein
MNPIIKQLALEAGGSHYPEVNPVQLQKFAELIVKECEKVVAVEIETNNKPNIDWGWDDHEQGYVTGMRAATKFIKEHFGVEE